MIFKIEEKFKFFLENALLLNKKYNISPLLYGSLGLEVLTNTNLNSDDIDILIPGIYLEENSWLEFKDFLEDNGYKLVDEHEHTFFKDNKYYSYAKIDSLESFANIKLSDINKFEYDSIGYKLLSLEQYLSVYKSSLLDEYRVNVFKKESKDLEKIKFINLEIEKRKYR